LDFFRDQLRFSSASAPLMSDELLNGSQAQKSKFSSIRLPVLLGDDFELPYEKKSLESS